MRCAALPGLETQPAVAETPEEGGIVGLLAMPAVLALLAMSW
jgi:hypothetical protein